MAYFGSRMLRHVAADLDRLVSEGFTAVLHTFSENDLRHYPRTMARIVERSHAAGLEVAVSPWGVGNLFGGEAESWFVAAHPEACQVLDDGQPIGVACPNQPAFRTFVAGWVEAVVAAGVPRVMWDEPAWARPARFGRDRGRWGCRCRQCARLYQQRFGEDMPRERTPRLRTFQREALASFLAEATGRVTALGASATLCLSSADLDGADGWHRAAATPGIDTLAAAPYWGRAGQPAGTYVGEVARRVVDAAATRGLTTQLWIQGFGLGRADVPAIGDAVAAARDAGADELWVWGVDACGHMDGLGTRDPEVVWGAVVAALGGG